jgi:hypothetical protein
MKLLVKEYILSIVACFAILLTCSFKEILKDAPVIVTNCYTGLTTHLTTSCVVSTITLNSITSCKIADMQFNKKVDQPSLSDFAFKIQCDDIENVFCCARLILDSNPCVGQDLINFIDGNGISRVNSPGRISAIFCKPN